MSIKKDNVASNTSNTTGTTYDLGNGVTATQNADGTYTIPTADGSITGTLNADGSFTSDDATYVQVEANTDGAFQVGNTWWAEKIGFNDY